MRDRANSGGENKADEFHEHEHDDEFSNTYYVACKMDLDFV